MSTLYDFDTPVTSDIILYAGWKQYVYVITVVKVWNDDDNAAGLRPDTLDVRILANGSECATITLAKDKDWKMLYAYACGEADVELSCDEILPAGYTLESSVRTGDTVKLTNAIAPVDVIYTVKSGGNSTWIKDSNSNATITVKRSAADDTCFSHFSRVQIDGTTLAAGDYEAKSGSTVITLKAAILQKLSVGDHTVTINFDDGKAETKLTIKAAQPAVTPEPTKVPQTGDSANFPLWIGLILLGLIGISVLGLTAIRYRK